MTKSILSVKAPVLLKFYGCLLYKLFPYSVKYLPVLTNFENPSGNPKLVGAFGKPFIKIMFRKPPMRLEISNNFEF
jgi:hypothetical protein